MKDYLLKLPPDLHKQLKITATLHGKTMMAFIVEAIKEKLDRHQNV